jgi:DNA-binding transcriptional LysR family regulator
LRKGLPIEVVIGAGESLIVWLLMPRMAEMRKKLPNVRLKFLNLVTAEIVRRPADGVIDFGVVRRDAVVRPLQCASLGTMAYSLYVPAAPQRTRAGARTLESMPLATLEGEGGFRRELAAIARKNRLTLRIELEGSSFPLAARAVATGTMAAILPSMAAVDLGRLGANQTRIPVLDGLQREFCLAWSPRVLKIRTGLEKPRQLFSQLFRLSGIPTGWPTPGSKLRNPAATPP